MRDVVGFFDNLSHEWALKFIEHRVADREDTSPDPEVVEGGSIRGWEMVEDGSGDSAGLGDFAAARECVPALRCARINLVLPAGEIPAPTRGAAASPGIESWVGGGNESGQA